MTRAWTITLAIALSACGAAQDAADTLAREQAKTVVNQVVTDRFPGVNPAPVTDCIIDAASAGEILQVASAAATGLTSDTVETVLKIAQRPEAITCIGQNSITLLG